MKYFILFISILFVNNELFSNDFQKYRDSTKFYQEKQDYNTALKWSKLTLEAAEKEFGKRNTSYIQIISNHGDLFKNLNQLDSAIYWMEICLKISKEIYPENHKFIAQNLTNLGESYYKKNNYLKADTLLKLAFTMSKTLYGLENKETAILILSLAHLNRNLGKFKIAEDYYNLGLEIYPKVFSENDEQNFKLFNGIAMLYRQKGDYKQAEIFYIKALNLMRLLHKEANADLSTILQNIGVFYYSVANYEKAKQFLNESLEMIIQLKLPESNQIASTYHNLAHLYHTTGDLQKADSLFQITLKMRRNLFKDGHNDLAKTLMGLADLYKDKNQYEESEKLYIEAIAMRRKLFKNSHPDLGNSLNSLATLYMLNMKKYKESVPLFMEALDINSKFFTKNNLESMSTLRNAAFAYEYLGQIDKVDSLWDAIMANSIDLLENYFPIISENEKFMFLEKINVMLNHFQYFAAIHFDKIPSLLTKFYNNQLYFKSIILNESKKFKNIVNNSSDSSYIKLFYDWEKTKETIAKYYTLSPNQLQTKKVNLDSIINYANEQEKKLVKGSEAFKNEINKKNFSMIDIQQKLAQNSAAIEIIKIPFKKRINSYDSIIYAALILKKNDVHPEIVVFRNGIELDDEYLKTYKSELKTDDDNKISYKNYWQPIAQKLQGIKKVYISPDGVYNKINLSTLKNPQTKKYLDDEIELITLTNLKDIVDIDESQLEKNARFELFGDPAFDEILTDTISVIAGINRCASEILDSNDRAGIALNPLPNTKIEVDEIAKLLSKKNFKHTKYFGKNANENNLKSLDNPTVLHLATHGYFLKDIELIDAQQQSIGKSKSHLNENPLLRSMLFFSGAKKTLENPKNDAEIHYEDGILTAYEAQNLNLHNTELVVLAACETGLGEIKNGEGVYGLQRAFIQAGAESLIMSLWQANDNATKDLMINFYKEWLNGKSKRQAFALAKKKVREQYRYPIFWGAYVMIGE